MNVNKHTPGPWQPGYYQATEVFRGIDHHRVVIGTGNQVIALCGPANGDEDTECDAHLIAAAPDLLIACKAAQERLSQIDPAFPDTVTGRLLASAIAKATTR